MRPLACLVILSLCAATASADLIPYYRMDSAFLLSDAVVHAQETHFEKREVVVDGWTYHYKIIRYRVLRSFKGPFAEGTEIEVAWLSSYFRRTVPRARAILFLQKDRREPWQPRALTEYRPLTAKLITPSRILRFVQMMNPGPLVLLAQEPENFQLEPGRKYDEDALLRDVALALEASRRLKKPVWSDPWPSSRYR